jgi:hypothetical protein
MSKFQYMREPHYGNQADALARLNELGDEGWEIIHISPINVESQGLNAGHMIWFKRENAGRKKKSDE